jgi:hypothetical protein
MEEAERITRILDQDATRITTQKRTENGKYVGKLNYHIKPDIKLCKKCDKEKPLSDFRNRGKGPKRNYGDCKQCERLYDYYRRRAKGMRIAVLAKDKKLPIVTIETHSEEYAPYIITSRT